MEKTIVIDGKNVTFKSTGATLLKYKLQTHRELLVDITNMNEFNTTNDFNKFDTEIMYNIIWVLAKTANPNILGVEAWLDTFESFPLMEVFTEAMELILNSMSVTKNV